MQLGYNDFLDSKRAFLVNAIVVQYLEHVWQHGDHVPNIFFRGSINFVVFSSDCLSYNYDFFKDVAGQNRRFEVLPRLCHSIYVLPKGTYTSRSAGKPSCMSECANHKHAIIRLVPEE